ncbi:MAG: hypothetical protein NC350_02085, partial [Corallococcus sp.]|nr:hypothetical protein [Corallococcus sp.]
MMNDMKYCEYFNVDETYFPCIDESAINAGVDWKQTYPHETFVKLLKATEAMLGGSTKRSVWIHGAYGTGKSRCAYALKEILESPEQSVREYWNKYDALKRELPLLEKLIGHKDNGIVVAYRYASGNINSPQQLFLAVQESVKTALDKQGIDYKGEQTLKESVIDWIEEPSHKAFVDSLLKKPEWNSVFSQDNAEEIVNALRKNSDVSSLMDNIFRMAAKEGITALSITADQLRNWLKDVIFKNNVKIVLIWDEFSGYFKANRNSLDEFQKIVSICEEAPFYLMVVTHPLSSIVGNDDSWKVVQQRFEKIEIELPGNIAFQLIGHAFSVKESAKDNWASMTQGLEASVPSSTAAVMKSTKISDRNVIKRILPIQPIAALALKNIANAYQSNQRSMFDFIKSANDDSVQAFQWFIREHGPLDDQPLLTVDMLWDFFYIKGREYLTQDIKLILDTYQQQQSMLNEKERRVLKAVLIMQAIDQRLGGEEPLLKPTDQNLDYAFEGIADLETSAKNVAKALVTKRVLVTTSIGDGKTAYGSAVLAGDGVRIEQLKADIRKKSSTRELVNVGNMLFTALSLTPALKLRFAKDDGTLAVATMSDFARAMELLKHNDNSWKFHAVLAVAKDENEAQSYRTLINKTLTNDDYKDIVVIDALSTPLGVEQFEQYVEYAAWAQYYQGNNNQQSRNNDAQAKSVLNRTWRDNIHDGQFYVYSSLNREGERTMGANGVHAILQTIVTTKFRYVFDFARGLTESQLKLSAGKQSARLGMEDSEVRGIVKDCEKNVLGTVWKKNQYWESPELQSAPIVIVKKAVDKLIQENFNKNGQIAIGDIYDYLTDEFGYSPCNMTAFVVGFLLKEYNSEPYRCIDAEGYPDGMTPDKLSEMIGNYISGKKKPAYIVKMTQEERTFYEATGEIWGVDTKMCSSPAQAATLIDRKMQTLGYPAWALEYVDVNGAYDIVKKYIELVQSEGKITHNIAIGIGDIVIKQPSFINNLKNLITPDNCKKGMQSYLEQYRDGKLMELAANIGAKEIVLADITHIFSVKHSAMWDATTGETEIDKLIVEYDFIKQTNVLLNVMCNTKENAFEQWRATLKFAGFSGDALRAKRPSLSRVLGYLLKICNREDILPEVMKDLLDELVSCKADLLDVLNNNVAVFDELYHVYLDGLTIAEKEAVQTSINKNLFVMTATASNQEVNQAAETYRRNQIKTQMFDLWRDLTGAKTPKDWSNKYQTPILCLVDVAEYEEAKHVFTTLNNSLQGDKEINFAINFLKESNEWFEKIKDASYRDEMFMQKIVGPYAVLLPDIDKIKRALDRLALDVYEWNDSPAVKKCIKELADAAYFAGGSEKAIGLIDKMNDAELKQRLKELVQK